MKKSLITLAIVGFLSVFLTSNVLAKPTCKQRLEKLKQDYELGYKGATQTLYFMIGECQYDEVHAELLYLKAIWNEDADKAALLKELKVRYPRSPFHGKLKRWMISKAAGDDQKKRQNQEKYGVYAHLIHTEGQFLGFENGIIVDVYTKLMWAEGPRRKTITWRKANEYCSNSKVGGFDDWRLPSFQEVRELMEKDRVKTNFLRWLFPRYVWISGLWHQALNDGTTYTHYPAYDSYLKRNQGNKDKITYTTNDPRPTLNVATLLVRNAK